MPLAADALCTVAEARSYLGHAAASDDVLEVLIAGYSAAIARYTGREWCPQETAVERKFAYDGHGYLSLAPYEARTVTQIRRDTDTASPTVLTADEWRLEPRGGTEQGTYLWVELALTGSGAARNFATVEIGVTGDWGMAADYDDVPADAKLACLIAVAAGYRNPEHFAGRDLGALGLSVEAPGVEGSLPVAARRLLYPYLRPVLA